MLVNGRPVDLPVRWAEGTLAARTGTPTTVRLALLDDDVNPLALAWRIGGAQLTVVRLDWPRPDADTALSACVRALKPLARLSPQATTPPPTAVRAIAAWSW